MTTLKLGNRGEDVKTLQRVLNLYPDGIFGKLTEEAVKQFQEAKGLAIDGIVGTKTWEAFGVLDCGSKRNIKEIIVHCTATPEGKDVTIGQIRNIHMQQNGWSDIGYHYVIYRDGSIHEGRKEEIAGAHCSGHNTISIGVCYVGGLAADGKTPKDTRTPWQIASLKYLLELLKKKYPNAKIYGHRDFANKACPSFDATTEYKSLK